MVEKLTKVCSVAQKRKGQILKENPNLAVSLKIETDRTFHTEYVVIGIRDGRVKKGYEYVEDINTWMMEDKFRTYMDLLRKGLYLGIIVPQHAYQVVSVWKVVFPNSGLRTPAILSYDDEGNITAH